MDGNTIYIEENYIAGISDTFGAKLHRHPPIEIYASFDGGSHVATEKGVVGAGIIAIGPNAPHAIDDAGKPGIALFVDPLTEFGYSLGVQTVKANPINRITIDSVERNFGTCPETGRRRRCAASVTGCWRRFGAKRAGGRFRMPSFRQSTC